MQEINCPRLSTEHNFAIQDTMYCRGSVRVSILDINLEFRHRRSHRYDMIYIVDIVVDIAMEWI